MATAELITLPTIQRAASALKKHITISQKKNELFESEDYVSIIVGLRKVPEQGRNKAIKMFESLFSSCVMTKL
jgi:hypothetical protein